MSRHGAVVRRLQTANAHAMPHHTGSPSTRHAPPAHAALASLSLAALLHGGAALAQAAAPTGTPSRSQVLVEIVLVEAHPALIARLDGPVEALLIALTPTLDPRFRYGLPVGLRGPELRDPLVAPVAGGRAASAMCAALLATGHAELLSTRLILAAPDAQTTVVLSTPRREPVIDAWWPPPVIDGLALRLRVRPHRDDAGEIRLDLEQDGALDGGTSAASRRVVARSSVVAGDGRSVLVRGLTVDRVVSVTERSSVLADVPVIGALFRTERRAVRRRALALILTPHWITGVGDLEAIMRARIRERQEWLDHLYLWSPAVGDRPPVDPARALGLVGAIHQTIAARGQPSSR
jgi:hypothetical protein